MLFQYTISLGQKTLDKPTSNHPITLVTAWFPDSNLTTGKDSQFRNPRHDERDEEIYLMGVRSFLSNITTALVIFCPPETASIIKEYRSESLPTRIITSYATVWDIPQMRSMKELFHTTQRELGLASADPTRQMHTPHMYGVWNAKPILLQEIAESNPFDSEYFFWHDIAAMRVRGEQFKKWPDVKRVKTVLNKDDHEDTVLLNVIGKQPCYIHSASLVLQPPEVSFTISGMCLQFLKTNNELKHI